ncbi:hypothetical protein B1C78_10870 [Thioalkalivibrio denitrificans]|uniref:DUF3750 domain-containing protein n=1 Tax=Thioalkalivibrio denitrificans TaxID=108003 RepID=A0A1V3NEY2_9GAMM|nr:DUF3750 domain-containing protein [Thioalkalivibrio denitrificans]OOG23620.1 hypothetical protein B1C78_10870 [Thioalkalivibrio denitrificans]
MKSALKWFAGTLLLLVLLLTGPAIMALSDQVPLGGSWRHADRSSAGLAPDPAMTPEAVVQVYGARAFDWRGVFAAHTWIALKPAGADTYTLHQVTRWSGLRSGPGVPDANWFGNTPYVLAELRGPQAEQAIARIEALVPEYPWADHYRAWPGPNSNTFTAWITRQVPELRARLPAIAVGKDYLGPAGIGAAPSGTGLQLSLNGLLGVLAAPEEGIEVNLLGLVLGLETRPPGIKLPGIGHVHFGRSAHSLREATAGE